MNTETENGTNGTKENRPYNGRLTIYHANSKGTGAAVRLELKLNRDDEDRNGCFFLEMAKQKTTASQENSQRTPATFDWAAKATVKLGFMDVCEILTVLEAKQEQAGGTRNGLYHESAQINTIIAFKRATERSGYQLGISRRHADGREIFKGHILLSEVEGTGLRHLLATALFYMVFHSSLGPQSHCAAGRLSSPPRAAGQ